MIDVGKLIGTTSTAGDTGGPAPRMSTASGMFQSLMALFGKELAAAGGEASGQGAPDTATPVGTEAPTEDGAGDGCDRKRAVLPGATVKPAMSLLTRILVARTPAHPASSTDEHDSPSPTRSLPGDPDKQADTATAVDDGQQPDFVPAEPTMLPLVTTPPAMAPTGDDNFGDDDAANASTDLQPRRRLHEPVPRQDTSATQPESAGFPSGKGGAPLPAAAAQPTGDDPPMMRPGASQVVVPLSAAGAPPAPAPTPELHTGASQPASVVVEATILGRETHLPPVARSPALRTSSSAPQSSARETKESPTGGAERPSAAPMSPTTTGQPPAPERLLPLPADANAGDADRRAVDGRDADTAAAGERKASWRGEEQAAATPTATPAPPAASGPSATGAPVVATDTGAAGLPARALAAVAAAVTNAAAPASVAPASTEAAAVPVRVFTVRLDLPDYGGVDLRMSLNDRALTLRIVADRDDTATRLRHDRDALTDLLRHGGTDASITAVDSRRADAGDGAPRAAPAPNGQGAGNGAGSGLPGGGSGRQPTGGQSPPAPPDAGLFSGPSKEITTDAPPPGAPRAGSLYV